MEILAHRGIWHSDDEKNSIAALKLSFHQGYGIETDIRDFNGKLVISHDIANKSSISLETLFKYYSTLSKKPTLALNIKADGLHLELKALIEEYKIINYFVFDMSIPDTLQYSHLKLPFLFRISEYEPETSLTLESNGIWYDSFLGQNYESEIIQKHLLNDKTVCIVSPELHKKPHLPVWEKIKSLGIQSLSSDRLMICTDFPQKASEYFNEK